MNVALQVKKNRLEYHLFLGYSGPCAVCFVGFTVSQILDWGWGSWVNYEDLSGFCLFRMRRCGFGVEAVFDFALSLDLLPHG